MRPGSGGHTERTKEKPMAYTGAKKEKRDLMFWVTAVLIPALVVLLFLFAWFQMRRMEQGVLDVCAVQQDAYVKLVLDQINLKDNRDREDIITDILSTLDGSSGQYWTFTSGKTMLFVKDVLETNKYKGLTANTYFDSDSARSFVESLQLNQVSHAEITLEEQEYVASGVRFSYRNELYDLCLLTNRSVLLDNNNLLGARMEAWIMILTALLLLLVLPLALVIRIGKLREKQRRLEEDVSLLNESLEKVNERLSNRELYHTQDRLWKASALESFAQQIEEKGITPVVAMYIHCPAPEHRRQFLTLASQVLDHRVLRFEGEGSDLLLLFVGVDYDTAYLNVAPLLSREVEILRERTVEYTGEESLKKALLKTRYSLSEA